MYDRKLETFIQVAESGSFSKASKIALLTPAAVMNHINQLERECGVALFNRTAHGTTLTESGRIFYEGAKKIIGLSRDTIDKVRQQSALKSSPQPIRRLVRFASTPLYPSQNLFALLAKASPSLEYLNDYLPTFLSVSDDNDSLEHHMQHLGESFDLIAMFTDQAKWRQFADDHPLFWVPFTISVPRSNPLSEEAALDVEDLHGQRLLLVARGFARFTDELRDFLEQEHPEITIVDGKYCNDSAAFNYCTQEGILMLSIKMWENVSPLSVNVPVRWTYGTPYGIWSSKSPNADAQAFISESERAVIDRQLTYASLVDDSVVPRKAYEAGQKRILEMMQHD